MFEEIATLQTLEKLYRIYLQEPERLDPTWVSFFKGMELFPDGVVTDKKHQVQLLIEAYRNLGHLAAPINPLEPEKEKPRFLQMEEYGLTKEDLATLFPFHGKERELKEIIGILENSYLQPLSFEYSHCDYEIRKAY